MYSLNESAQKFGPASLSGWMSPLRPRLPGRPSQVPSNEDKVFAAGAPAGSAYPY
jgi:hypothetical protein